MGKDYDMSADPHCEYCGERGSDGDPVMEYSGESGMYHLDCAVVAGLEL